MASARAEGRHREVNAQAVNWAEPCRQSDSADFEEAETRPRVAPVELELELGSAAPRA